MKSAGRGALYVAVAGLAAAVGCQAAGGAADGATAPEGGNGPPDGSSPPPRCDFTVTTNQLSAKLATVGVVEWSLAGPAPTSAKVV